jgi:hypothetical protein
MIGIVFFCAKYNRLFEGQHTCRLAKILLAWTGVR